MLFLLLYSFMDVVAALAVVDVVVGHDAVVVCCRCVLLIFCFFVGVVDVAVGVYC